MATIMRKDPSFCARERLAYESFITPLHVVVVDEETLSQNELHTTTFALLDYSKCEASLPRVPQSARRQYASLSNFHLPY